MMDDWDDWLAASHPAEDESNGEKGKGQQPMMKEEEGRVGISRLGQK
jgi:hypothetical protein